MVPSLPRKATNVEVLARLQTPAMREARVLRLSDAQNAFGGWVDNPDAVAPIQHHDGVLPHRCAWCCTSRFIDGNADNGRVYLKTPPALSRPRGG